MSLKIHLGIEDNKLLLQAFSVWAHEMVFPKMLFERVVVDVILLLSAAISAIANVATLVLVSAMCVQLIVSIEALATETTFWMSLKPALIDSARVIVAELLVLPELSKGEELVLMREDFLVSST